LFHERVRSQAAESNPWNVATMKNLVVTGGSRGIGAAVAMLAAKRGYSIAINYAQDDEAAARVARNACAEGVRAIAVRGDVASEGDVLELFRRTERELGALHALVACAGISGGMGRVDELSAEALERVFAVNVVGTILCAREAVRRMSSRHGGGGGAVVTLSSAAAHIGSAGEFVHYAATKGAIDVFTLGLAREVATEGIRVNAVSPGLIATEFHATAGDATRVARLRSAIPMQREGTAEEVAEAVMWLLSDAASYVTGAILPVTGGR
jgi:NAD(P)-dependent dehydrogenase (short-subunit alcohol dehydrogenase family)